jgi:hypothetical protein
MTEQTAVSGLITEFLLQSVDNIIRIFPSWPGNKDAEFTNLRARGGFLVSAQQKKGNLQALKIVSTIGGELKLVSPWKNTGLRYADGSKVVLTPDSLGVVHVITNKGQQLEFVKL